MSSAAVVIGALRVKISDFVNTIMWSELLIFFELLIFVCPLLLFEQAPSGKGGHYSTPG